MWEASFLQALMAPEYREVLEEIKALVIVKTNNFASVSELFVITFLRY